MKIQKFLFLLLIFLQISCKSQSKKINGVSFVASRDSIKAKHISPVLKVNSNYVALMPYGFIRDLSSPKIIHNTDRQWFGESKQGVKQYIEALQKQGIESLIQIIVDKVTVAALNESTFTARKRHIKQLEITQDHINKAEQQLAFNQGELSAEELRLAQNALSEITGEFSSDDLLGRIFSSFCIGK